MSANHTCIQINDNLQFFSNPISIGSSQAKLIKPLDGSIYIIATFLESSLKNLKGKIANDKIYQERESSISIMHLSKNTNLKHHKLDRMAERRKTNHLL